jgi:hypothetical protein
MKKMFFLLGTKKFCQNFRFMSWVANERASKNELTNHVSGLSISIDIVFPNQKIYILY